MQFVVSVGVCALNGQKRLLFAVNFFLFHLALLHEYHIIFNWIFLSILYMSIQNHELSHFRFVGISISRFNIVRPYRNPTESRLIDINERLNTAQIDLSRLFAAYKCKNLRLFNSQFSYREKSYSLFIHFHATVL